MSGRGAGVVWRPGGEAGAEGWWRWRWRRGWPALLPLLLIATPSAEAGRGPVAAPDFSAVTTRAEAERLVRAGRLVRIHLFPTELGGPEDPQNIGYIPPEAEHARQMAIGTISGQFQHDLVNRMTVTPDYKGRSIVPSRIVMKAWHSAREGSIEMAVEVW